MKKTTIYIAVLATMGYCYCEEPAPVEKPAVVELTATDFDSVDPGYELDTYQRAAIEVKENAELLAKSEKITVAGYTAVEVTSSLECGLITYQDNSFTALPDGVPYDAEGNEIDVDLVEATNESPISLKVYLAQVTKPEKSQADS